MKKIYCIIAFILVVAIDIFSQIRILPVGESTTETGPGYRMRFYELAKAQGFIIDMVGPKNDGAKDYDGDHAGYSGSPADAVQRNVEAFYSTILADAILIWEGTNDAGWASQNGDTTSVGKLVDKVLTLYPSAQVFVASIPPMSYNAYESEQHGRLPGVAQKNGETFNENLPILVARRAAAGKKIHYVNATSLTLADVSSDGIHPNQQGYDRMAMLFFEALKTTVLDSQKPSTPTNLSYSTSSKSELLLTWTASTDNIGVAEYDVFKDGVFYSSTNTNTISVKNLGAGQTYKFKVQAKDAVGNLSEMSTELTITIPGVKETIPPTVPTNLSATEITTNSFIINWSPSTDNDMVLHYDIYKDGVFYASTIGTETKFLIANLLPSSSYTMTVKAKDRTGNISGASRAFIVATLLPPIKYEAENATLAGGPRKATSHAGYSGNGFAEGFEAIGAAVTFTVSLQAAGQYNVILGYANSMGTTRTLSIYVNGIKIKQTELPSLANWATWSTRKEVLALNSGTNTISYKYDIGDLGFVNVDCIDVQGASLTGVRGVSSTEFIVFPNPIQNYILYVRSNKLYNEYVELSLYNSLGNKVYHEFLEWNSIKEVTLPISLSNGIYMLELKKDGSVQHNNVIINHN